MADDVDDDEQPNEDIPQPPFFVRPGGKFRFELKVYLLIILVPFVFISPTDYRTQVVVDDNQTTSELLNEKKTNEGEEESGGM